MDLALVTFEGVDTAAEAYAAARDRSGSGARWANEIGLVEHHRDGHLVLRGVFAGHYVDVDEAAEPSEEGAAKGLRAGGLIGALLGPPGFAVGSVVGAAAGSREAEAGQPDREPTLLADKLRAAVPAPGSALVLLAEASDVDQMLGALEGGHATRRTLSADDLALIDVALSDTPPTSTGEGR